MIKHIENKQEFLNETKEGLVLVDFFATWCGPCRMLGPVLEEIDEEKLVNAQIIKVDVDQANELARDYGVAVIPTLVLLKDGKEIKRNTGYMPQNKLIEFVNK